MVRLAMLVHRELLVQTLRDFPRVLLVVVVLLVLMELSLVHQELLVQTLRELHLELLVQMDSL